MVIEHMYFSLSMAMNETLSTDEYSKILNKAMLIYNSFYCSTEEKKMSNPLEGTIWENK
jgi:hypothetical protein